MSNWASTSIFAFLYLCHERKSRMDLQKEKVLEWSKPRYVVVSVCNLHYAQSISFQIQKHEGDQHKKYFYPQICENNIFAIYQVTVL